MLTAIEMSLFLGSFCRQPGVLRGWEIHKHIFLYFYLFIYLKIHELMLIPPIAVQLRMLQSSLYPYCSSYSKWKKLLLISSVYLLIYSISILQFQIANPYYCKKKKTNWNSYLFIILFIFSLIKHKNSMYVLEGHLVIHFLHSVWFCY